MTPPADRMSFDSNVAVTIGVLEPSTRIMLKAADLKFASISLKSVSGMACS